MPPGCGQRLRNGLACAASKACSAIMMSQSLGQAFRLALLQEPQYIRPIVHNSNHSSRFCIQFWRAREDCVERFIAPSHLWRSHGLLCDKFVEI